MYIQTIYIHHMCVCSLNEHESSISTRQSYMIYIIYQYHCYEVLHIIIQCMNTLMNV